MTAMTYTVSCPSSIQTQCLIDLISRACDIHSLTRADGFTSVLIECDAATAAVIAERWHVSEI